MRFHVPLAVTLLFPVSACASSASVGGPDPKVPVTTGLSSRSDAARIDSARSLLVPLVEDGPGIAVAVSRHGEPVWIEGMGWADVHERTPVTPDETLFRIYSVSKAITHLAVARLVDAGELDLRAPVRRYVDVPETEPPMTPLHLLQHTSGIRHYRSDAEATSRRHCETVEEAVSIFRNDPLIHAPGTGRTYSSWGYVLLSRVLEAAAGTPFEDLVSARVLAPARVTGIRIDDPTVDIPDRATFYTVGSDGPVPASAVDNTCKWGAGGYLSTATALLSLWNAVHAGELLSAPVFDALVAPAAETSSRGHRVIEVAGWGRGGAAFTALDLDSGTAVVLLANGIGEEWGPAVQKAYGRILELFSVER